MVPRHPSCARIRLTEKNGSLRVPVYTLQFFLPKNYALFKEPAVGARPAMRAPPFGGKSSRKTSGARPDGGRDWNRTSDLVLIRDAL